MQGVVESWMRARQVVGSFYGASDHRIDAIGYATTMYVFGNNFEQLVSMALHNGYRTNVVTIVQLEIANSGRSAGDTGLIYQL